MKPKLRYLGPKGSFSEHAAILANKTLECKLEPKPNLSSICNTLGKNTLGIIPYYNFLEGVIQEGLDQIYENNLRIIAAVRLPIRFAIGSCDGSIHNRPIASHPKALAQCDKWISANSPNATLVEKSSTSEAIKLAVIEKYAVIGLAETIRTSGLKIHSLDIGNRRHGSVNFTDFFVLSKATIKDTYSRAEANRTLVAITPNFDKPGLLGAILSQFSFVGINLAKIHSRPASAQIANQLEPQMFYMELVTSPDNPVLAKCIAMLEWKFGKGNNVVRIMGGWTELPPPCPESPDEELAHLDSCLIVGSSGGFGRLFTDVLTKSGIKVKGIDIIKPQPRQQRQLHGFWKGRNIPEEALKGVKWVLFCIPEAEVVNSIDRLKKLQHSVIITDIASVKSNILRDVKSKLPHSTWISLHPMFAPTVGFDGSNVCITAITQNNEKGLVAIQRLLSNEGACIVNITAKEHDKSTAKLQAATHLLLLGLGRLLTEDGQDTLRLASPINNTLMAMLARMLQANPELYHSLQVDNPFANSARNSIIKILRTMSAEFEKNEPNVTKINFKLLQNALGNKFEELSELANIIVKQKKIETQRNEQPRYH